MKKLLFTIALTLFSLPSLAVDLTLRQKLVLAEAATALATGWFVVPAAILTGNKEGLCHVLEGHQKPSSYNPNPDQIDQCPKGVWLRIIPYLDKD